MFAKRFKILREEKNLTQEDLSLVFTVSRSTIGAWENGKEPSYDMLKGIANYFEVSIDYLLGNTDLKDEVYKDKKLCSYLNECTIIYHKYFKDKKDR